MAGRVTVTSTTDSPEQVAAAVAPAAAQAPDPMITGVTEPIPGTTVVEGEAPEGEEEAAPVEVVKPPVKAVVKPAKDKDKEQTPLQQRIDRLTWNQNRLKEENEALRQRLEGGGAPKEVTPQPVEAPAEAKFTEAKPRLDQYDSVEEWSDAKDEWNYRRVRHDLDQEQTRNRRDSAASIQGRQIEATMNAHTERLNKFRETATDFNDVAKQALEDRLPVTPVMEQHFIHSEMGPQLMYHLAKNPAEAARIAALPTGPALVALGRLEAQLESERGTTATVTTSSAPAGGVRDDSGRFVNSTTRPAREPLPAPVRKLGSGSASASKRVEDMTQREYNEARAAGRIK